MKIMDKEVRFGIYDEQDLIVPKMWTVTMPRGLY